MPWKPLRPCNYPGCPNLSEQAYCEIHRKKVKAETNSHYDKHKRDKQMYNFYNSPAWRKLRDKKIRQNPLCEECYRSGRLTKAVIVDHILPARENQDKRLDINNLQSLCTACHNRKHSKS